MANYENKLTLEAWNAVAERGRGSLLQSATVGQNTPYVNFDLSDINWDDYSFVGVWVKIPGTLTPSIHCVLMDAEERWPSLREDICDVSGNSVLMVFLPLRNASRTACTILVSGAANYRTSAFRFEEVIGMQISTSGSGSYISTGTVIEIWGVR